MAMSNYLKYSLLLIPFHLSCNQEPVFSYNQFKELAYLTSYSAISLIPTITTEQILFTQFPAGITTVSGLKNKLAFTGMFFPTIFATQLVVATPTCLLNNQIAKRSQFLSNQHYRNSLDKKLDEFGTVISRFSGSCTLAMLGALYAPCLIPGAITLYTGYKIIKPAFQQSKSEPLPTE